jgi:hypothetical protein
MIFFYKFHLSYTAYHLIALKIMPNKVECLQQKCKNWFLITNNNVVSVEFSCGHQFHLYCLMKKHSKKQCPNKDCSGYFDFESKFIFKNAISWYNTIFTIPLRDCRHITRDGVKCSHMEYPFREGYCRKHFQMIHDVVIPKEYENKILTIFGYIFLSSTMKQNSDLKNPILKIKAWTLMNFMIQHYSQRPSQLIDISSFQKLTEFIQSITTVQNLYTKYGILYPEPFIDALHHLL